MTDLTRETTRPMKRSQAVLATVALGCLTFVFWVVNYHIFSSRIFFAQRNPEYVARKPPTISRAISDPSVGEPFAFWVSLSAGVLIIGAIAFFLFLTFELKKGTTGSKAARNWVYVFGGIAVLLQAIACIGMVILSNFRFPHDNDLHMFGSFMFFIAQALMVLSLNVTTGRYHDLSVSRPLNPWMVRLRYRLVWVSLGGPLFYLFLFLAKDFDLGALHKPVYQTYVLTEPVLISYFLALGTTFYIDLTPSLRRHFFA